MTLQQWMTANGLTPKAMGERLGVHEVTVYRYLQGARTPEAQVQRRIAEVTGGEVTPNDLVLP